MMLRPRKILCFMTCDEATGIIGSAIFFAEAARRSNCATWPILAENGFNFICYTIWTHTPAPFARLDYPEDCGPYHTRKADQAGSISPLCSHSPARRWLLYASYMPMTVFRQFRRRHAAPAAPAISASVTSLRFHRRASHSSISMRMKSGRRRFARAMLAGQHDETSRFLDFGTIRCAVESVISVRRESYGWPGFDEDGAYISARWRAVSMLLACDDLARFLMATRAPCCMLIVAIYDNDSRPGFRQRLMRRRPDDELMIQARLQPIRFARFARRPAFDFDAYQCAQAGKSR